VCVCVFVNETHLRAHVLIHASEAPNREGGRWGVERSEGGNTLTLNKHARARTHTNTAVYLLYRAEQDKYK